MQQVNQQPKSTGKIVGIVIAIIVLVAIVIYILNKNKSTPSDSADQSSGSADAGSNGSGNSGGTTGGTGSTGSSGSSNSGGTSGGSGNTGSGKTNTGNTEDLTKPIGPYPDRCMKPSNPLRKGKDPYENDTRPEKQKIVHQFFDKFQINYGKTGVAFGFMKGIDVAVTARNLLDLKDEFIKYMNVGKGYTEDMVKQGEFLCENGNNLRLVPFLT